MLIFIEYELPRQYATFPNDIFLSILHMQETPERFLRGTWLRDDHKEWAAAQKCQQRKLPTWGMLEGLNLTLISGPANSNL